MASRTPRPELTAEQQNNTERLKAAILDAAADDIRQLAETLAQTTDATILGANEFTVRDIVHRIGAKAVETALRERKKGGTTVPA